MPRLRTPSPPLQTNLSTPLSTSSASTNHHHQSNGYQTKMMPSSMPMSSSSAQMARVTYIPPLRDGACGTTPRSQRPMGMVMREEMMHTMKLVHKLAWDMGMRMGGMAMSQSWADRGNLAMRVMLACLEACMLVAAVPLWLVLPGGMFAAWMGVCGISRHCHTVTLPALSRIFNRRIMCICQRTYGMPLDILALCLQRCGLGMVSPGSRARRNLYLQMRCALLDDSVRRCVVLCHNNGAVAAAQAVAQLCADLPRDKLSKLEVYTFGAAASEFVVPLLDTEDMMREDMDRHPDEGREDCDPRDVHVEHFAMTNDPFAQIGVLHSVRQDMEGRFCGSVFVINEDARCATCSSASNKTKSCSGLMMEDYLMALFPDQMMVMSMGLKPTTKANMMPNGIGCMTGSNQCSCGSTLDAVMTIDRDCAEKREIAAIGSYHAASQAKKGASTCSSPRGKDGKRLSWTGLAAAAAAGMVSSSSNGMTAGMAALEMARSACRNCEGRTARQVSWLSKYLGVEGKVNGRN
ncbi:hypothetical protein VTJ49DRAFT_3067 [Mycothermus thermophilus]|uniref:Uncharacterized protein n=1 Tax=Humicola insolens TaxID=85995 RepID=A0ABR3VMJ6_HUMIN